MSNTPRTPEQRIDEWAKQPGAVRMPGTTEFLACVRQYAHIGYGHMQQLIEWEWQSKAPGAWGPEHFHAELTAAEQRIAELEKYARHKRDCAKEQFEWRNDDREGGAVSDAEAVAAYEATPCTCGLDAHIEADGVG